MSLEGIDKLLEVSHVLYNERMVELIKENKKLKEKIICIETKRTIYMCYDYDIFKYFRQYLNGEGTLGRYVEAVNMQEYIYPANYVKMRYLENHLVTIITIITV